MNLCIAALNKEVGKGDTIFATIELRTFLKVLTYRSLMRALGSSYIRLVNESNCIKSCEERRFWLLIVSLVPPIVVQCALAIRTFTLGKLTFIVHGSSWKSIISRHGLAFSFCCGANSLAWTGL